MTAPPPIEAEPLCAVLVEAGDWRALDPAAVAETARAAALRAAGLDPAAYGVSVLFTNDARIAALNAAFRGRAAPTDVLSWPTLPLAPGPDGRPPPPPAATVAAAAALGDVALAAETVAADAATARLAPASHAIHLLIHGVLHLLGYDHGRATDADVMEGLERRAMAALGLHDPYG